MGILDDALNIQDTKRSQRLLQAARKAKIEANKIKEGTYRGIDLIDGTAKIQLDDQPIATSGYRLITNAPLGDGDRVSIRPNSVGLPRADAKNVAPQKAIEEEIKKGFLEYYLEYQFYYWIESADIDDYTIILKTEGSSAASIICTAVNATFELNDVVISAGEEIPVSNNDSIKLIYGTIIEPSEKDAAIIFYTGVESRKNDITIRQKAIYGFGGLFGGSGNIRVDAYILRNRDPLLSSLDYPNSVNISYKSILDLSVVNFVDYEASINLFQLILPNTSATADLLGYGLIGGDGNIEIRVPQPFSSDILTITLKNNPRKTRGTILPKFDKFVSKVLPTPKKLFYFIDDNNIPTGYYLYNSIDSTPISFTGSGLSGIIPDNAEVIRPFVRANQWTDLYRRYFFNEQILIETTIAGVVETQLIGFPSNEVNGFIFEVRGNEGDPWSARFKRQSSDIWFFL